MPANAVTALAAWPWQVVGEMLKWTTDGDAKKPLIPIAVGGKSIAFPRRSVKADVDRARVLRTGSGRSSIPSQSAGIHDIQLRVDLPPISNGHGPFFRQLPGCQIERFGQRHGVGKDCAAAVQAAESAVQALDGVGGIHDPPRGLGELEHGTDAVPAACQKSHNATSQCSFLCDRKARKSKRIHLWMASFFKFIAANLSLTQAVTAGSPRYSV